MANVHVNRLTQKKSGSVDFALPPLPEFPDSFNPHTARLWWAEMQEWRNQAEANIKTALLAIRSEDDTVATT